LHQRHAGLPGQHRHGLLAVAAQALENGPACRVGQRFEQFVGQHQTGELEQSGFRPDQEAEAGGTEIGVTVFNTPENVIGEGSS
jgi:hypothetical protein